MESNGELGAVLFLSHTIWFYFPHKYQKKTLIGSLFLMGSACTEEI